MPVINVEDGSILSGDDAPKKKHLEQWLLEHPGYLISGQGVASVLPPPPAMEPEHAALMGDMQAVSNTILPSFFMFILIAPF